MSTMVWCQRAQSDGTENKFWKLVCLCLGFIISILMTQLLYLLHEGHF